MLTSPQRRPTSQKRTGKAMRVYVASRGSDCVASTSIEDISSACGSTGDSLRTLFSRHGDSFTLKGWNVYRTELMRIQGRGRQL